MLKYFIERWLLQAFWESFLRCLNYRDASKYVGTYVAVLSYSASININTEMKNMLENPNIY